MQSQPVLFVICNWALFILSIFVKWLLIYIYFLLRFRWIFKFIPLTMYCMYFQFIRLYVCFIHYRYAVFFFVIVLILWSSFVVLNTHIGRWTSRCSNIIHLIDDSKIKFKKKTEFNCSLRNENSSNSNYDCIESQKYVYVK